MLALFLVPTIYGNSLATLLVFAVETCTNGLRAWQTTWTGGNAVTNETQTAYGIPNHQRIVTVTAPDGTQTVTVYQVA